MVTYQYPADAWVVVPVVVVVRAVITVKVLRAFLGELLPPKSEATRDAGKDAVAPPVAEAA